MKLFKINKLLLSKKLECRKKLYDSRRKLKQLQKLKEEDRKAAAELKAAPVLGLGDTAVGFVNWATQGNLGTDDLQEQWNKTAPSGDNPFTELARKISGLLIPSFVVPGAVIPRLAAIPGASKLPGAMQFLGSAAARLGIDTTIQLHLALLQMRT